MFHLESTKLWKETIYINLALLNIELTIDSSLYTNLPSFPQILGSVNWLSLKNITRKFQRNI